MHFGSDPPLFSKPKGWVEPPRPKPPPPRPPPPVAQPSWGQLQPPQPPQQAGYNPFGGAAGVGTVHNNPLVSQPQQPSSALTGDMDSVWNAVLAASGGAAMGAAAASSSQQQQQQQVQQPPPPQPQPPPKEDPAPKLAAAFRAAAAATLNKRLHASLSAIAQQAAAEGDEQLRLQATLRQRGEQLQHEVAAMQVWEVSGVCRQAVCGCVGTTCMLFLRSLPALLGCSSAREGRTLSTPCVPSYLPATLAQAERVALEKLSQDLSSSCAQLDRWGPCPSFPETHRYICSSLLQLVCLAPALLTLTGHPPSPPPAWPALLQVAVRE